MTVRAVLRYVSYVMHRHPSAETTATPRCLNPDCQWTAPPTGDADVCTDMCIGHTGRTGHMTFLREFSEVAVVERAQVRVSVTDLGFHAVADVLVRMGPGYRHGRVHQVVQLRRIGRLPERQARQNAAPDVQVLVDHELA